MDEREARRRALVAFGGVEKYRETLREGRGVAWLSGLTLDFRLGFRMLVKYPGLTVVAGLAMAFAICIGAGTFEFMTQAFHPTLPLPGGELIVGIQMRDVASGRAESRVLHDFASWRGRLSSIEDLGAFRTLERNLVIGGVTGEPIELAEISASAFRVARVAPLMGRALTDADERPGAPLVVVIGHDVWQRRFAGDPNVVGRRVRVGTEFAEVVGVMPEGFAFPIAHSLWVPFRTRELDYGPRQGPAIQAFGRLAPGASLERAQAELTALGQAASAAFPATHEHLRPRAMPFARTFLNQALNVSGELDLSAIATLLRTALNLPVVLFLVLVCGNIALLVFARAATRESEIVVRNALGASRARIVGQLFVESLVLGSCAALVGLVVAGFALRTVVEVLRADLNDGGRLPFWFHTTLSPTTIVYALVLTVIGAAIAGVLPALKVTRGLGERIRQGTAGGGGFRFGGIWTAVIIAQVAVTVPFPVLVYSTWAETRAIRAVHVGIAEEEYFSVRLELDRETVADPVRAGVEETISLAEDSALAAHLARLRTTVQELDRRLVSEAAVAGVTFADRLPRMYHPYRLVDVDEGGAAPLDPRWPGYRVSAVNVERDFFDVLDVPILAGRGFLASDIGADPGVVIVNRSFVENVLGGRNPIGRRIRYTGYEDGQRSFDAEGEPWFEIVGVVRDLGTAYGSDPKVAGFYHPVAPGSTVPLRMAVRVAGDAAAFAPRLRTIAADVDPALRLYDVMRLDHVTDAELRFYTMWFWLLLGVSGIALILALAGIYAVLSFTVSQRTREIGIRVALGADRRRIIAGIFRRPAAQVGLGLLSGSAIVLLLLVGSEVTIGAKLAAALVGHVTAMAAVCMLAAVVPSRRALRVEPAEALRWD
jgi:predicted permease